MMLRFLTLPRRVVLRLWAGTGFFVRMGRGAPDTRAVGGDGPEGTNAALRFKGRVRGPSAVGHGDFWRRAGLILGGAVALVTPACIEVTEAAQPTTGRLAATLSSGQPAGRDALGEASR